VLLAKRSLESADAIAKISDRLEVSTGFLQEMRHAAELTGVGTAQFEDGLSRLNRRLGLFIQDGGGPGKKAFEELGLAAEIQSGQLRGAEAVFDEAVARLGQIEDASKQAALASQLFGEDAGPRLVNLLSQGASGIETMRQEARDLGLVLDDELLRCAEGANDAMQRLTSTISANLSRGVLQAAPAIETLANTLATSLPSIISAVTNVVSSIGHISESLGGMSPELQGWGTAIAGIFLASGPILTAIAGFVKVFSLALIVPAGTVAAILIGAGALFWTFKDEIIGAVSGMVEGVREWISGKLAAVLEGIGAPIEFFKSQWQGLSDWLVGNSLVPDMVTATVGWFRQLDDDMVRLAEESTGQVRNAFERMGEGVGGLIRTMVREGKLTLEDFANSVASITDRIVGDLVSVGINMGLNSFFAPSGAAAAGGAIEAGTGRVAVGHGGGIVGQLGRSRQVPMSAFIGADRFHGGGAVGLQPGERPIIAQVGETITPRGQAPGGTQIVNIINKSGGEVETRRRTGPRGENVLDVVVHRMRNALASGEMDLPMRSRYGLAPAVGPR